jgi:hypothetical protein
MTLWRQLTTCSSDIMRRALFIKEERAASGLRVLQAIARTTALRGRSEESSFLPLQKEPWPSN